MMPSYVLDGVVVDAPSLKELGAWSRSLSWLPRENRDFQVEVSKPHLEGLMLTFPGLVPLGTGQTYVAAVRESLARRESDIRKEH